MKFGLTILAFTLTACASEPDAFVDERLAGHVQAFAQDAERSGRANITSSLTADVVTEDVRAECSDSRLRVGAVFLDTAPSLQVRAAIYRALGSCLLGRSPADNAASFMWPQIDQMTEGYLSSSWNALVTELFLIP